MKLYSNMHGQMCAQNLVRRKPRINLDIYDGIEESDDYDEDYDDYDAVEESEY